MSKNVLAHLESHNSVFASKMSESQELAKIFMALLNKLVVICNDKGIGIEDVDFQNPYIVGKEIKAQILFSAGSVRHAPRFEIKTDFTDYVQAKNLRLAQAVEKNPRLASFFEKVIGIVDQYCFWVGKRFSSIKLDTAHIDKLDRLVLKLAS